MDDNKPNNVAPFKVITNNDKTKPVMDAKNDFSMQVAVDYLQESLKDLNPSSLVLFLEDEEGNTHTVFFGDIDVSKLVGTFEITKQRLISAYSGDSFV